MAVRWKIIALALGLAGLTPSVGWAATRQDPALADRIAAASSELNGDYAALDRAIGDARIVMLGEPWHGDGAAIAERARIVRHLHETGGFDVLVFEADFFALHRGWERARTSGEAGAMAADNIYPFWSQTGAAADLWAYVDAQAAGPRPLIVAGIDTKVTGRITRETLPGELADQLARLNGVGREQAQAAAATLDRLLTPRPDAPEVTEAEFGTLSALIGRLAERLAKDDGGDPFWAQTAQSLNRMMTGESRDLGMAENLIWLATRQYPGRRIIVWAHNNHVLTDKWTLYDAVGPEVEPVKGTPSAEDLGRLTYLGEAARRYFGPRSVYAVATLSNAGEYSSDIAPALYGRPADFDAVATLQPAPPASLEAAFHRAGREVAFVDLRPWRGEATPVPSRVLDYSQLPALPLRIWDGFDGVLFLDRTHGLNAVPGDR
jgi:erythromycin esterase-like protein